MAIIRSGSAEWSGGIKDGRGKISTESGALAGFPYGFASRFGRHCPGGNFSAAISALLEGDRWRTLGKAGAAYAQATNAAGIATERHEDMYLSLLGCTRKSR